MSYMVENVTVEFAEDSFEKGQIGDFHFSNSCSKKIIGNSFKDCIEEALKNIDINIDLNKCIYFHNDDYGTIQIEYEGDSEFIEASEYLISKWRTGKINLYTVLLTFKVSKIEISKLSDNDYNEISKNEKVNFEN